jgi:Reverse transcriptase (RNA-dependent DNA polymerase)
MISRWIEKFELKPGVWVFVPTEETREEGQAIKSLIRARWEPPSCYFHLQPGGHVAALKSHLQSTIFIHLDIKNFFGSINRSRITRTLKGLVSYKEAAEIAKKSTVSNPSDPKKPMLPFGFVQSPILASICLHKSALGKQLEKIAQQDDMKVSVYVDDLVISTTDEQKAQDAMARLKAAAQKAGFTLNESKQQGPSGSITAFNISLANHELLITPERIKKFSAVLVDTESTFQKAGIVRYISTVNTNQSIELEAVLEFSI